MARNKMNKEQKKRSHIESEKSSPILSRSSAAFLLVGEGMKREEKSHSMSF